MREHRSEALTLASESLDIEPAILDETWSRLKAILGLDQGFIILLQTEALWAIAQALTPHTSTPNYLDFIDYSILRSLHPEAVTLIGTP